MCHCTSNDVANSMLIDNIMSDTSDTGMHCNRGEDIIFVNSSVNNFSQSLGVLCLFMSFELRDFCRSSNCFVQ